MTSGALSRVGLRARGVAVVAVVMGATGACSTERATPPLESQPAQRTVAYLSDEEEAALYAEVTDLLGPLEVGSDRIAEAARSTCVAYLDQQSGYDEESDLDRAAASNFLTALGDMGLDQYVITELAQISIHQDWCVS